MSPPFSLSGEPQRKHPPLPLLTPILSFCVCVCPFVCVLCSVSLPPIPPPHVHSAANFTHAPLHPHLPGSSPCASYPSSRTYAAVNGAVSLAVLLTFPLQLQPAAGVAYTLVAKRRRNHTTAAESAAKAAAAPLSVLEAAAVRVALTCTCAAVVTALPQLDLLIGLLGAMCQSLMAAMPMLLSLQVDRLGLLPERTRSRGVCARVLDGLLAAVCLCFAAYGTFAALQQIRDAAVSSPSAAGVPGAVLHLPHAAPQHTVRR